MKKLTTEEFIKRAKETHGDKYDYTNTVYTNRRTSIKFNCPIHDEQEQLPENHINYGCRLCGIESAREKRKKTPEKLLEDFHKAHGDRYDYSKVNYINIDTPVEIICREHGSFWQIPYEHQTGANCPKCHGFYKTKESVIKAAQKTHGDKYDYSETEYVSAGTKLKIICPKHGPFYQSYVNHVILGMNCPNCAKTVSKGEDRIENYLKLVKVEYEIQKTFEGCKNKKPLRFDFYIPQEKLAIEYDGIQHFTPIGFGGDPEKTFTKARENDLIKEKFCEENGIKLLRIPYDSFDNIEDILRAALNKTFIMTWPEDFDTDSYIKNILDNLGEFPYETWSELELKRDYDNITSYIQSRMGIKIIKHFHKNIWSSRVGNCKSPLEAWGDKELMTRTIVNRMKYRKPPYTPKMIRDGLTIARIAPKVSVFRPSLARYLTEKYLGEYDTVFDPFSGFSGRMLGVCSLGKRYIGQDLNSEQVRHSNEIIDLLELNAVVSQKNIRESSGEYDCLLTCPPYNLKETWGDEIENLSCDEWIDICLANFKCGMYVFVVDNTKKYDKFITESLSNKSHLSTSVEKVVVIRNGV